MLVHASPIPFAASWTTPLEGPRWIALYDGHCRFCTRRARELARVVGERRLALASFQDDGVLDRFPGVSHDACMQRIHVVRPDGRVFAGGEAVARALTLVRWVGWMALVYYVPGIRQTVEWGYRGVASNRYRMLGGAGGCDGGTCRLHG